MKALYLITLLLAVACTSPQNQDESKADSTDEASAPDVPTTADTPGGYHLTNPSITHHYTGVIGGKYKFLMNLNFDSDSIHGQYRYYSQKDFLDVEGKIDENTREFSAEESYFDYSKSKREFTGSFQGVQNGDSVKGTWSSADKKKTFNFVLATDEKEMPAFNIFDNSKVDEDWLTMDTILVDYGTSRQVITGFECQVWKDLMPVSLEDVNFDGYLDLLLVEFTGAKNTPYLYWLYDPQSGEFVAHPELEATSPVIDVQHKQIVSDWSESAMVNGTDKYIFQDGRFYLIERTESDWEADKTVVTRYKIVDGKSVKL